MFTKNKQPEQDTEENVGVEYAMVFRAQVPVPAEQRGLISEFEEKVETGNKGGMKAVFVSHGKADTLDYAEVRATKTGIFKPWEMSIGGTDRRQELINIGCTVRMNQVCLQAAERLADAVTDVGKKLERAVTYDLTRADILDVEFGDPDAPSYEMEINKAPKEINGDSMLVTASIPMPEAFYNMYDRVRDSVPPVIREGEGGFTIGINSTGRVIVEKTGRDKWVAAGIKECNYSETFKGFPKEDVIESIAFDLAAEQLFEDEIVAHIRNHSLREQEVLSIQVGGKTYDHDDFAPPSPDAG